MKKLILPLVLVMTIIMVDIIAAQAQVSNKRTQATIIAFLEAVYKSNIAASNVAKQYIALSKSESEFSTEKRFENAAANISMLRDGKSLDNLESEKLHLENIKVIPYRNLDKSDAPTFDIGVSHLRNVYAAVQNGKAVRYFMINNNRITSFDFITKGKGGPSYFIEY